MQAAGAPPSGAAVPAAADMPPSGTPLGPGAAGIDSTILAETNAVRMVQASRSLIQCANKLHGAVQDLSRATNLIIDCVASGPSPLAPDVAQRYRSLVETLNMQTSHVLFDASEYIMAERLGLAILDGAGILSSEQQARSRSPPVVRGAPSTPRFPQETPAAEEANTRRVLASHGLQPLVQPVTPQTPRAPTGGVVLPSSRLSAAAARAAPGA